MLYLLDRRQGSPTCSEIPSETARPYPGDGSNGGSASLELATVTGSVSTGSVASLTVAV